MQEDNHGKKDPDEQPEEEEFEISIRFEDDDEGQDAPEPGTGEPAASAGRLLEDPQIQLSHTDETALAEAMNSLQKQMQDLAEQLGLRYYLDDATQEVAKAYGAECTPDPFVFDDIKDKHL